jgi:hypothetical protein
MKFRYLLLASSSRNYNQIIQNINIPACRNCIHYIPPIYGEFESTFGKCGKYGNKNIITNEITYDFATSCRNDENKCGFQGKDFEVEENIEMKIIKHNIQQNTLYILLFSLIILYCVSYADSIK